MSKVALKGDALGTGSVTLAAPNTNDTLEFELPVTGTHLASAQADGMPLGPDGDPVVESGSNSDGGWTRWADGTQICTGSFSNVPITADTNNELIWVLPIAFLAGPIPHAIFNSPTPSSFNHPVTSSGGSTTQLPFYVNRTSSTVWAFISATGRWK